MSYANNAISAPVSIYDVQRALGNSSSCLGTLCRAVNINKWAKYKPVAKNKINTTDELRSNMTWKDGSIQGETAATWWKGTNGKCGLNYVSHNSIADLKSDIIAKTIIWSHVAPFGGVGEPFRQIDFNEYHHDALPPTYSVAAGTAQLKAGSSLKIQIATSVDDGYNLRFSNIATFDQSYYTVAVYEGDALKFIQSASKPIGQYGNGESIEIDIPYNNGTYGYQGILQENHTYQAYVFISSVQYTNCATSAYVGNYTYVALPCGEADYGMQSTSFLAKKDSQWATIDAVCPDSGRIVNWTVYLYGAGAPSNTTVRLIDLQGNPVGGQSRTVDFTAGAESITAGDGTTGWAKSSTAQTSLLLPSDNPEAYMVEFVSLDITARAMIDHDINLNM